MKHHETSGPYTVCSIGGPFGSPNAKYEWWYQGVQFDVNLPDAETARELCRAHAEQSKAAA